MAASAYTIRIADITHLKCFNYCNILNYASKINE